MWLQHTRGTLHHINNVRDFTPVALQFQHVVALVCVVQLVFSSCSPSLAANKVVPVPCCHPFHTPHSLSRALHCPLSACAVPCCTHILCRLSIIHMYLHPLRCCRCHTSTTTTQLIQHQQHLFSGIGREMTPNFLGGDLDFDAVARTWWDKMDAAITQRAAHPQGPQVCLSFEVCLLWCVHVHVLCWWGKVDAVAERAAHPHRGHTCVLGV